MNEKNYDINKVVPQSIQVFERVSDKIHGLIDCSVKDFEILNTTFKKYFTNLQNISKTSQQFLKVLLDLESDTEFAKLLESNLFVLEKPGEVLANWLREIKKTDEKLNYQLLLISNLNQDISTLKLLFTNLKFDPLINIDHTEASEHLEFLFNFLNELAESISDLSHLLRQIIEFSDDGFIGTLSYLFTRLIEIKGKHQEIFEMAKNAQSQKEKLDALEKKRVTSTSEIITNLQFQDILRQKIEHVQEAYHEIISSLKQAQNGKIEIKEHELYKIRDISTLQSAQLIYSNQEYQTAVETILNKINELSNLLSEYFSNWNHFYKPQRIKLNGLKALISENLANVTTQLFSLTHLNDKFHQIINSINQEKSKLFTNLSDENNYKTAINVLLDIKEKVQVKLKQNKKNSTLLQINNELLKFESGINKLAAKLKGQKKHFGELCSEKGVNIGSHLEMLKTVSESYANFFHEHLSTKIQSAYTETIKLETVSNFNIKEVAYYKNFEKEIHEIIGMLDELLVNINMNKDDISVERLEHLKKIYTMESERDIHNLIGGLNQLKDIDVPPQSNDEVEFF